MTSHVRIAALDVLLDLDFPAHASRSFVEAVEPLWSRCLATHRTAPRRRADPLAVFAPSDDDDEAIRAALQRLSQEVTLRLIAAQAGHLLMLHAGAVSDPATGSSLAFVAPSGGGKTTLAAVLGQTHTYLTDETVAVDTATRRIFPYPKPLSVSGRDSPRKIETSPDALGLLPAHPAPTLARTVLLNRLDGPAQPVHAEELGTLDAIAALIPETSALHRLRRPLHAVADLLGHTGPLVRLTYTEARDLVPWVSQLLEVARDHREPASDE